MSENRRVNRVESEVQKCVSLHLITRTQEELGVLLTVTRVQMPSDLKTARVYISALGENLNWKNLLARLQAEAPEIQRKIASQMPMKNCPRVQFFKDESTEKILKVEGLLREIGSTKKSDQ